MGAIPTFFPTFAPTANKASAATGVLPSVILAQWAIETGYGTELNGHRGYGEWNFGNVSPGGSVASYPTRTAGLQAYIVNMNSATYTAVRTASTWDSQAKALGASPWATSHYETPTTGGYPGSQLVWVIDNYQLTKYDGGVGGSSHQTTAGPMTGNVTDYATWQSKFLSAYGTEAPVPKGFGSTASTNDIIINGSSVSEIVGDCTITVQVTLSITKASTITLTIHDPTRVVVNSPVFMSTATLTLGTYTFVLQGLEKAGSVLTLTFIPSVVFELQQATGAFTVPPGRLTRTQFAQLLVSQIEGATFWSATDAYLYSLKEGYAHTTKEQLSRGTIDAPLENSWTCLQRLANEIQWVCFEVLGRVYFGPYSFLASQTPVLTPLEFKGGITTITGTFTTGQPTGEITITCVADSWTPTPGECIRITKLGAWNGTWIVSELTREDIEEPTITVTLMQPQPGLPEPASGGTNPAVGSGAGTVQTTGGKTIAKKAVAFALSKVGHPYSETTSLRLGPEYYDCSGLVYEAYLNAGVKIGTTTYSQWPDGAGTRLPAKGMTNLRPGDLLFFGSPPYKSNEEAQHVVMVVSVERASTGKIGPADGPTTPTYGAGKASRIKVVEAADPAQGVITTTDVNPTAGAAYGPTLVYLGATRPAP